MKHMVVLSTFAQNKINSELYWLLDSMVDGDEEINYWQNKRWKKWIISHILCIIFVVFFSVKLKKNTKIKYKNLKLISFKWSELKKSFK